MGSLLDSVFGLPTHVLVVHATVVLLPLAVIGAVVLVARRSLIHRLGWITVVLAGAGMLAGWLSKGSGEQLASRIGYPQPHVDYGNTLPIVATAFFVLVLAYWVLARGIPGNRPRPWWVLLIGLLVIATGVALLWSTVVTGHSGAEASWGTVIENTTPGQVSPP